MGGTQNFVHGIWYRGIPKYREYRPSLPWTSLTPSHRALSVTAIISQPPPNIWIRRNYRRCRKYAEKMRPPQTPPNVVNHYPPQKFQLKFGKHHCWPEMKGSMWEICVSGLRLKPPIQHGISRHSVGNILEDCSVLRFAVLMKIALYCSLCIDIRYRWVKKAICSCISAENLLHQP